LNTLCAKNNLQTIIKLVVILCCIFFVIGIVSTWNSPAKGYESSIYSATPPLFWVSLVFNILAGIGIIVHQLLTSNCKSNKTWILGFLLIGMAYVSFLSLYVIRGYIFYGGQGDIAEHMGEALSIISTGHASDWNVYPVAHISVVQYSQIMDIPVNILFGYAPIIFNSLFPLYIFVLAKNILSKPGQVILATLLSTTMICGWNNIYMAPNQLTNLFLPLVLFLLWVYSDKTSGKLSLPYNILLVIILIFTPIMHPIMALELLLFVIAFWLIKKLFSARNQKINQVSLSFLKTNSSAFILLLVWFVAWISHYFIWSDFVRRFSTLLIKGAPTQLGTLVEKISYAREYNYNVVFHFINVYGGISLFVLLAFTALPFIWKRISPDLQLRKLFVWYGPLVIWGAVVVVLYLSNQLLSGPRLFPPIIIACMLIIGFSLNGLLEMAGSIIRKRLLSIFSVIFVILVLACSFILGIRQVYPSLYVLLANDQYPRSETAGVKWFFANKHFIDKQDTPRTLELSSSLGRFAYTIIPVKEILARRDISIPGNFLTPEWHFGYDQYATLGEQYDQDQYLVLNQEDRRIYIDLYPEMAKIRFLPDDFSRIEADPTINKVYYADGESIYYVRAPVSPSSLK
jgi:hypothetical protein